MWTCANAAWKEQPLFTKVFHRPPGRSNALEGREQHTEGLLDLSIRIEDDGLIFGIDESHW